MITDNVVNYIQDRMTKKYELDGFKLVGKTVNERALIYKLRPINSLMDMELKFKVGDIPKVIFQECLTDYQRSQMNLSEFLYEYGNIEDFGGNDIEADIDLCIKRVLDGKLQFVDEETGEALN